MSDRTAQQHADTVREFVAKLAERTPATWHGPPQWEDGSCSCGFRAALAGEPGADE